MNFFIYHLIISLMAFIFFLSPLMAEDKKGITIEKAETKKTHSGEDKHKASHKMKVGLKKIDKSKAIIEVQGMVCAFCAQGIEKNFKKRKEVKSTKVDLDKMLVILEFNKGMSLSIKEITEVVTSAGFKFKGIKKDVQ